MNKKLTLKEYQQAIKKGMKVLFLDCETCLGTFCGFHIGKSYISYDQILTAPQVMCVQYKWEGDKDAHYIEWEKVRNRTVYDSGYDNSKMLAKTAKLIEGADLIVGQNVLDFDLKMLQDGLVNNKLPPINNDYVLDILKMSRKVFRPLSHKLDSRAKKYGYKGKNKMDFDDWKNVTFKNIPISKKMGPYGVQDVHETQKIFYREFNHYKLPKKIEKLIHGFLEEEHEPIVKPRCKKCRRARQTSFDIKYSKKYNTYTCNNCGYVWKVK